LRRASFVLLTSIISAPLWAQAPVRLTTDGSFKQHLQWSPNGKTLLMTRIHQGKMALWTMNADGSELKRLLPNLAMPHFDGHWSPDGRTILYVHDVLQGTDGKLHIHRVNADGTGDVRIIPNKAFEESPRWARRQPGNLWRRRRRRQHPPADQRGSCR